MSDDEIYFGRSVTPSELVGIILMAQRISPKAKPGSLLKGERKPAKRDKRPGYLALVRRCPCCACDADPAGEAAHVRLSAPGKLIPGMGIKPDDCWTLPLCHVCHMRQHKTGELEFWRELGIDPITLALTLSAEQHSIEAMRTVIFAWREQRK